MTRTEETISRGLTSWAESIDIDTDQMWRDFDRAGRTMPVPRRGRARFTVVAAAAAAGVAAVTVVGVSTLDRERPGRPPTPATGSAPIGIASGWACKPDHRLTVTVPTRPLAGEPVPDRSIDPTKPQDVVGLLEIAHYWFDLRGREGALYFADHTDRITARTSLAKRGSKWIMLRRTACSGQDGNPEGTTAHPDRLALSTGHPVLCDSRCQRTGRAAAATRIVPIDDRYVYNEAGIATQETTYTYRAVSGRWVFLIAWAQGSGGYELPIGSAEELTFNNLDGWGLTSNSSTLRLVPAGRQFFAIPVRADVVSARVTRIGDGATQTRNQVFTDRSWNGVRVIVVPGPPRNGDNRYRVTLLHTDGSTSLAPIASRDGNPR